MLFYAGGIKHTLAENMPYTYRERFNRYYGFPLRTSHTLPEIARLTRYRLAGLKTVTIRAWPHFGSSYGAQLLAVGAGARV